MQPRLKKFSTKDYYVSIIIDGNEIIPSDSFAIGNNEYVLLEIVESVEEIKYLKILGIKGTHLGNHYLVPVHEFETSSPRELERSLQHYQH